MLSNIRILEEILRIVLHRPRHESWKSTFLESSCSVAWHTQSNSEIQWGLTTNESESLRDYRVYAALHVYETVTDA